MSDAAKEVTGALLAEIDKNLPAMVGEQLKKRLTRCEELELETVQRERRIASLERETADIHRWREASRQMDDREKAVRAREGKVTERERKAELTAAQEAFKREERANSQLFDLAKIAFRAVQPGPLALDFNARFPGKDPYGGSCDVQKDASLSGQVTPLSPDGA